MKKKILLILGAAGVLLVVFVAGIVGLVFWLTGGAVTAGDEFLTLIGEGRIEEAYDSTAAALRSQQEFEAFDAVVRNIGLTGYESVSWSGREVVNDQATLDGTVTTVDGGAIPLWMSLIKEGGEWRVMGLEGEFAGAAIAGGDEVLATSGSVSPSEADVLQLVHQTMLAFGDALERRDFTAFYGGISDEWKQQTTAPDLAGAFQPLIDEGTDFTNVRGLEPILDQTSSVDGDGILGVSGFYPSQPYRARFELEYIHESPSWKLFGIRVVAETPADEVFPAVAGNSPSFTIVENPDLVGRLGRVVVVFPEGTNPAQTLIEIRPEGAGEATQSAYGRIAADLLPGTYAVTVSGVRIPGVEVHSGSDTVMAVGVLRVAVGSSTLVGILSGGQEVASAYGSREFGLPAGNYEVEISGQREAVTIGAGESVVF